MIKVDRNICVTVSDIQQKLEEWQKKSKYTFDIIYNSIESCGMQIIKTWFVSCYPCFNIANKESWYLILTKGHSFNSVNIDNLVQSVHIQYDKCSYTIFNFLDLISTNAICKMCNIYILDKNKLIVAFIKIVQRLWSSYLKEKKNSMSDNKTWNWTPIIKMKRAPKRQQSPIAEQSTSQKQNPLRMIHVLYE